MDKKTIWAEFAKPVVVLLTICVVTSGLLALTNAVTEPIIKENAIKAADATRTALLPDAENFVRFTTDVAGVTEAYKTSNEAGFVITAEAKGYAGSVPVMVAFSQDGKIVAVNFLTNSETPGLGQKVRDEKFSDQFKEMPAEPFGLSAIDSIAGATISSSAAVTAINSAIETYLAENGAALVQLTPEEQRAALLPDAGAITPYDGALPEGVKEAYKGEKYGLILYTEMPGFYKKPLTAAVAFDDAGAICGVWFDASAETKGVGDQIGRDKAFVGQYIGKTNADTFDAVAGATVSSTAANEAVKLAVAAWAALQA